jgi:hypothetical protein
MSVVIKLLDFVINKLTKINNRLKVKYPNKKAQQMVKAKMRELLND